METTRHELKLAQDLITHTIRHLRDARARTKNNTHTRLLRQAIKDAIYGNRQARGHLDVVTTRLHRAPPDLKL